MKTIIDFADHEWKDVTRLKIVMENWEAMQSPAPCDKPGDPDVFMQQCFMEQIYWISIIRGDFDVPCKVLSRDKFRREDYGF